MLTSDTPAWQPCGHHRLSAKIRLLPATLDLPTAAFAPPNCLADVERIADPASDLPHMLPSEAQFAAAADALGVSADDALVLYDNAGIFSAARAWWTWAVFGHRK